MAGRWFRSRGRSGCLSREFQSTTPESRVNAETGLIERLQRGLHRGYETRPFGKEEEPDSPDHLHAESSGRGARLVIVEDDPALPLGSEGNRFGLARSEDEAECRRKGRIGDRYGRQPGRRIAELLDHRWRCKHGAEQPW
jgi:hypothetical protein